MRVILPLDWGPTEKTPWTGVHMGTHRLAAGRARGHQRHSGNTVTVPAPKGQGWVPLSRTPSDSQMCPPGSPPPNACHTRRPLSLCLAPGLAIHSGQRPCPTHAWHSCLWGSLRTWWVGHHGLLQRGRQGVSVLTCPCTPEAALPTSGQQCLGWGESRPTWPHVSLNARVTLTSWLDPRSRMAGQPRHRQSVGGSD